MLMKYGEIKSIKDPQWYLLELRSERTLGPTLKRLGKYILSRFDDHAVEVFIPIQRRDHENFELLSDCYVFVHSDSLEKVRGLRSVVGVATLLTDDISKRYIKVDDEYVRGLVKEAKDRYFASVRQVSAGAFVRILDGVNRDYCGTVTSVEGNYAQVKVLLKGRVLLVETPVGNLLYLGDVPEDRRVYYYCEAVDNYCNDAESPEPLTELAKDLVEESPKPINSFVLSPKRAKKHRSRYETVTALVRRLIDAKEHNMVSLMTRVLDAIKEDEIKKPKTAHIIYSIIKRNMVDVVYQNDPKVKTFRDVLRLTKSPFSLKLIESEAKARGIVFPGEGPDED